MTLISEKIKPVALAVLESCLSEGVSKYASQLVANKKFLELYNYLMEVDLRHFWAWLCLSNTV